MSGTLSQNKHLGLLQHIFLKKIIYINTLLQKKNIVVSLCNISQDYFFLIIFTLEHKKQNISLNNSHTYILLFLSSVKGISR